MWEIASSLDRGIPLGPILVGYPQSSYMNKAKKSFINSSW